MVKGGVYTQQYVHYLETRSSCLLMRNMITARRRKGYTDRYFHLSTIFHGEEGIYQHAGIVDSLHDYLADVSVFLCSLWFSPRHDLVKLFNGFGAAKVSSRL